MLQDCTDSGDTIRHAAMLGCSLQIWTADLKSERSSHKIMDEHTFDNTALDNEGQQ